MDYKQDVCNDKYTITANPEDDDKQDVVIEPQKENSKNPFFFMLGFIVVVSFAVFLYNRILVRSLINLF